MGRSNQYIGLMESQNDIYRQRTKQFAINIIRLVDGLPKSTSSFVLGKQLLRSATSVAANYRAMCLARSDAEKFAKLCIVVEEADETLFWLELIGESGVAHVDGLAILRSEANQLTRVFTAYRAKLKQSPARHD